MTTRKRSKQALILLWVAYVVLAFGVFRGWALWQTISLYGLALGWFVVASHLDTRDFRREMERRTKEMMDEWGRRWKELTEGTST